MSTREYFKGYTDSELIVAFREGDERAFSVLVGRYRNRLLKFVNFSLQDKERSEDLVQNTFIRVFNHLHRFDLSKKFSTWVYTIAGNLAKNEIRNRYRNPIILFQKLEERRRYDDNPLEWRDEKYLPNELYRKRRLKRLVRATAARLPDHHRLIFTLREMEGKSYEEIAEITGVNLGTVKSRLHRARENFAEMIRPLLQ